MYELKEGKINSYGLFNICVISIITKIFLGVPRTLIQEGGSAAWLLTLLAAVFASTGIFFLVKLLRKFPGKNIIEIAQILWGAPGRIIVALLLALFFLLVSTIVVREFSETMLITVLPRTPISVIIFFFIAAMVMGSYNGLEVITRASTILFPFIIGGILSILLLASNFYDFNNLFPVFGTGVGKLLWHSPGRSSLFTDLIFVGLIASSVSDTEKIGSKVWMGFAFSALLFVVVEILYISAITTEAGSKLYIPLFQLARIIYMGRFVQRIEALYIFIWFFTGALQLSIALYSMATALCRGFRIPIYQPLLFPLGLIVFSASFIPQDLLQATQLDLAILQDASAVPIWGLTGMLFLTSLFKKGGGRSEKKKTN